MKPNFLIVGAAKAGTTSLYHYLKQHPDIGFPDLKEPKYFSSCNLRLPHNGIGDHSIDNYVVRDWPNYLKLFRGLSDFKRIGEASPDYLFYHEKTAPLIKNTLGDIPIIISLRNPVKRAFSAYMYLRRDNREWLSFGEALEAEEDRLNNNWDFIWGYRNGGFYFEQVKNFMNTFSSVKVILLEDLKKNPDAVIKELYSFLDVNPEIKTKTSIEHNPSGIPKNMLAKFILQRNNMHSVKIREGLKLIVPRWILENFAKRFLKKVSIDKRDYNKLKTDFRDDIANLEMLLGKDLSNWVE